ncbi:MAG: glycosyltransferase family 39 protein [Gemmatimonadaceae bacterium]|nr:glycosyltransferase family 39 protein [Gemmatimonadaceae bacterium]
MTDTRALLVLLLSALLGRFITLPRFADGATRVLNARWTPFVIGAITVVFMTWLWGGLDQVAVIHDEAAYLLQAKIYASGHWTEPGLPLPEFFEQYHVFVTPILTPKYPPGHALVLIPGIWLGLPGLMPMLLLGLCGALVFEVARRLANPWVGLLAWFLWMTAPGIMDFDPGYLSETSTSALWMLGWYALLRWMDGEEPKWLAWLAFSIGLGFLSRPVTMVIFALPAGVVVLRRIAKRNAWKELQVPFGVGFIFLGIWGLWCQRTTGSPFNAPYALYSRYYFPDDVIGFGLTGLQPLRPLNADMALFNEYVKILHKDYTLASLPMNLRERIIAIAANMWATRAMLLPLAALSLVAASAPLWFALGTTVLLVLAYLCVGHAPQWTVYYVEIQPVLAFATAVAWWRIASLLSGKKLAWPLRELPAVAPGVVLAVIVSALLLFPYSTRMVSYIRLNKQEGSAYHRNFRDLLRLVPGDHIMVFIRYAPNHSPHESLVTNEPDLAKARVWTVYDRGADNIRLIRLAPARTPYLFDDEHRVLVQLDSTGVPRMDHIIREPGTRY